MVRFGTALALLTVAALAGACTSDTSGDQAPRSASSSNTDVATVPSEGATSEGATPTEAPTAAVDPPLVLSAATVKSKGCAERPRVHDWAWMDVQWKANQDLESFSFSLVDAQGVEMIGEPVNVPPVNFGGRFSESAEIDWDTRADIGDSRFLEWRSRGTTDFWSPIEDESGLLLLHLRVTGRGTFSGVQADYTTLDGETGSVVADTSYDRRHAKDCPGF